MNDYFFYLLGEGMKVDEADGRVREKNGPRVFDASTFFLPFFLICGLFAFFVRARIRRGGGGSVVSPPLFG
jgi:hypothetical protein